MWFTHFKGCRKNTVCCFAGLLVVVVLVFLRINFRFVGRGCAVCRRRRRRLCRDRGLQSRVLFDRLSVGLVVFVVVIGVVGRIGCLSLLLTKSLFQLSCAVVSQVVSIVRS